MPVLRTRTDKQPSDENAITQEKIYHHSIQHCSTLEALIIIFAVHIFGKKLQRGTVRHKCLADSVSHLDYLLRSSSTIPDQVGSPVYLTEHFKI